MNTKFLGLVASLVLLGAAPVQATTIYQFDTYVSGGISPAGTVSLDVNGSNATFTVSLPSNYSFGVFALNLQPGSTVNPSGLYTVYPNAGANFSQGATWPNYGPFNTVLAGSFGNSLTFTVSNFAGIFDQTVSGAPIWFVASYVNVGGSLGVIAADQVMNPTPIPATLPLFAGGLGTLALLVRRRKRNKAAARV